MAKIEAISYFLPENVLSNEDLAAEFPEWSVGKIAEKIGISTRHIAGENECSSDLAFKAAEKLLAENQFDRNKIDYLLLCTQSPDYFLPTTACLLQDQLRLRKEIGAFDFNLGCSGFVYGLGIANSLITSGDAENVLLITAETYSKFIDHRDKSNRSIFGDAAAACIITASEGSSIHSFAYGTDGTGGKNLIVKYGGMRFGDPNEALLDITDKNGQVRRAGSLFMSGQEIFNFTLRVVPDTIERVLLKSGLKIEEIDLFVFHQANKYMLDHLRKRMGIPEEKFYIFMMNCGNTVSSTIPIALANAIKEGKVKTGMKIMLLGFGVGYSWAGCIIEY